MFKLFYRGMEWCNLAAYRSMMLWAVITMIVGPAWADEAAKNQAGQQAGDNFNPNAAASSVAAWGKSVAGLQCSVGLQRPVFRVGDPIEVQIQIQNVSGEKLTFYYPPDYRAGLLEIRDEQGKPVRRR